MIMTLLVLGTLDAVRARSVSLASTLVGVWQDNRYLASGWSDVYIFFPDGTFRFHYNQMNCTKRKLSYGGKWKLSGNHVQLTVTDEELLTNVAPDPDEGPDCITGDTVIKKLRTPRHEGFSVTGVTVLPIEAGAESEPLIRAQFGRRAFWRHRSDPREYD